MKMTRPYRAKGEQTWVLKVQGSDGRWVNRSTGTDDEATAMGLATLMHDLRRQGKWELIDCVVIKNTMKLKDLPKHFSTVEKTVAHGGRREARSLAAKADSVLRKVEAPTLDALIDKWEKKGAMSPTKQRYLSQMRRLIPKGSQLGIDWFTATNIQEAIDDGAAVEGWSSETKRKHKIACSRFWIAMLKTFVPANPVAGKGVEIELSKEERAAKHNPLFYEPHQVEAIARYLPDGSPLQAMIALSFATAAEWEALKNLRKEDFYDMERRLVRLVGKEREEGRKERRVSFPMHPKAPTWCWPMVERYVKSLKPGAWFLPRARYGASDRPQEHLLRDEHTAACEALGIEDLAFHKYRHSFAVFWIEQGILLGECQPYDQTWLKEQLGHAPGSVLLYTTYGKHIKQAQLAQRQEQAAAMFAASAPKQRKAKQSSHLKVV